MNEAVLKEAVAYINGWGDDCFQNTDGSFTINWVVGIQETVSPKRVIELANEIWQANGEENTFPDFVINGVVIGEEADE